jgi:hypothetical protein
MSGEHQGESCEAQTYAFHGGLLDGRDFSNRTRESVANLGQVICSLNAPLTN